MADIPYRKKSVFICDEHHFILQSLRAIGKEQTIQHVVDKAIEEYLERHHKNSVVTLKNMMRQI